MTAEPQPFFVHLQEVRRRLQYCLLVLILGSIVGYYYYPQILTFLLRPLNQPLYYTSPTGGLDLILKVSLSTGFLMTVPVVAYQILQFLAPVLPASFNRLFKYYVLSSAGLLLLGMALGYYISLPATLHFLAMFGAPQVNSLISTDEYFSFLFRYLISFGLLFQMPLILVGIHAVTPLPIPALLRSGRYVLLGSFILAAILTPTPDIVNQALLAVPIILLYYISVFIIWCISK